MTIFPGTDSEMAMLSLIIERNCDCKHSILGRHSICGAHQLYMVTQEELNELVFTRWRFRKERRERNAKPN